MLPVDACDSCTMLSAYAPASSRPGLSKTPVSVTLVVDTSKSMRGHKWEVTIRAVTQAIDMLCEEDLFAIVTYSAEVRAAAFPTQSVVYKVQVPTLIVYVCLFFTAGAGELHDVCVSSRHTVLRPSGDTHC